MGQRGNLSLKLGVIDDMIAQWSGMPAGHSVRQTVSVHPRVMFPVLIAATVIALAGCGSQAATTPTTTARVDTASPSTSPAFTPPASPTSPAGLSLHVGGVATTLGHRGSVMNVVNHGAKPVVVNGYPDVSVLNSDGQPLQIDIVHANSSLTIDAGPSRITLAPGDCALSALTWSNAVTSLDAPQTGAYVTVTTLPTEPPQTIPLLTDLGSPGQLNVTGWARELNGWSGTGQPVTCSSLKKTATTAG